MKKFKIKLTTIEDVKRFVQAALELKCVANVHNSGNIIKVVSASSIMGLFSLNLSEYLDVELDEEISEEEINETFGKWRV